MPATPPEKLARDSTKRCPLTPRGAAVAPVKPVWQLVESTDVVYDDLGDERSCD